MTEISEPDVKLMEAALTDWWLERARQEVESVAPKAIEYGATDLADIGHGLAGLMGRKVTNEEATEIGIYFYVVGKMGRWTAAIREGRRVSDDTLLDLGIYIKMAQRSRDVGGWPFGPEEEQA